MTILPDILNNARELRKRLTDAEELLWHLLRNRRFCGYKFRRQHPVSRYILDFFCLDEKLAIELDGGGHNEANQQEYDAERTKVLEGAGIRVLRFWNDDVLKNTDTVLEEVLAALTNTPHPPQRGTFSPREKVAEGRMRGQLVRGSDATTKD